MQRNEMTAPAMHRSQNRTTQPIAASGDIAADTARVYRAARPVASARRERPTVVAMLLHSLARLRADRPPGAQESPLLWW